MVVQFSKFLFLIFVFILTLPVVFAEEQKYKKQIIFALQKEAQIATKELSEAITKCNKKEKESNPSLLYFKNLNISQKNLNTALFYLSYKARTECVTKLKYKNFAYYLIKYQRVLKYYDHPEYEDVNLSALAYSGPPGVEEELKLKYNAIDLKHRIVLEKVPELSQPFNFSQLMDRIESEVYGSN
ncbi:hypothetical protein MNBD_GAMMA03-829 [hydrothermal vent metagenome]|uniref:Uncharacterized protein n=1 Tax=hydrothermal vent metagenome TaxID=652676 RepID=A0A3B0VQL3_9ZZZZ